MTDKLPGNLLALFQPRPPLRYLLPCDHAPEQRHTAAISGVAQYLEELHKPDPDYEPTESWLLARDRKKREKKERQEQYLKDGMETCMLSQHPLGYNYTDCLSLLQGVRTRTLISEEIPSGPSLWRV